MKRTRPLKRVTPLERTTRISPKRASPRRGPQRAPSYLTWVRSLPCCAPGIPSLCLGPVHAHHAGTRGLGQKADDDTAIPLCGLHHRYWHDAIGDFRGWQRERRARWAQAAIEDTRRRWEATHLIDPGEMA